jgi:hypothetical protein
MTERPRVAVVIRFRDEARWLRVVLAAVRAQRCVADVELIGADNASADGSRMIAEEYMDRVLHIEEYRPGAALNRVITATQCDTVVVLSAHALPANEHWLASLLDGLSDPGALAVYGAQVYPLSSRFLDKRDLDIFSHPRARRETVDSDFWNANAAFPRREWKRQPFEESIFELEDHHWTKCLLPSPGRFVRYAPGAAVYHYGHDTRNDRTFLPRDRPGDAVVIDGAIAALERPDEAWPAVMSAGLVLGSLSHITTVRRAVPAMGCQMRQHPDFDVRWRMAHALGRIGTPAAVPFLLDGLRDPSLYPRDEAAWSLARLGALAVPAIERTLPQMDTAILPFAALALGMSGERAAERRALALLDQSLDASEPDAVRDALYFLGEIAAVEGAGRQIGRVSQIMGNDDDDLARAAAWCWGKLAEAPGSDAALDASMPAAVASGHPDETVRAEAGIALGRLARASRSRPILTEVAGLLKTDPSGRVRYGAMQSLRLAADTGWECAAAAAAMHGPDDDFGVAFERRLALRREREGSVSG